MPFRSFGHDSQHELENERLLEVFSEPWALKISFKKSGILDALYDGIRRLVGGPRLRFAKLVPRIACHTFDEKS